MQRICNNNNLLDLGKSNRLVNAIANGKQLHFGGSDVYSTINSFDDGFIMHACGYVKWM